MTFSAPIVSVTVLEDRDYVDVSGDAALVPDAKRPRAPPQRIYYRASRWDGGIHLDYWWFFRFNVSPVATRYMCLGGLAIPEVSCFDQRLLERRERPSGRLRRMGQPRFLPAAVRAAASARRRELPAARFAAPRWAPRRRHRLATQR